MTNININDITVVENIVVKEEKDMKEMTVRELRNKAKEAGVKGYSKMNKADLVAAIQFFTNEERKANEAVVAPAVEDIVTEKSAKYEKLMKAVAKEIISQTLVLKDGKMVQRDYALFFKPTKTQIGCNDYIVMSKRLCGVVAKVIGNVYGNQHKTAENIEKTFEQMIAWDMITKVAAERTYVVLTMADMNQDEKDQLNDLWKNKAVKVYKSNDGKAKVTAITDNGKTVLNELYPNWTYRASAEQMNNTYKLSR